MTNSEEHVHPDIAVLDAWANGLLAGRAARAVEEHLDTCAVCRLELGRLRRFHNVEADRALARDADWHGARTRLDRAFGERILPSAVHARRTVRAGRRLFAWLAPIVAAAAVVLVFAQIERSGPGVFHPSNPLRGGAGFEYGITLQSPLGEIARSPEEFTWHAGGGKDYFTVEVFTSRLVSVCRIDRLENPRWSVPDSIRTLFEAGTVYLWHVRGYRGLEGEVVSPNGWFVIKNGT